MSASKKNTFFGGAAILTAGVIIVKIIGAIYKIPLFNILGKTGFGHFSVAYTIFNVLLTLSTAGLPVALSKTISEANTLGKQNQVQKVFRTSLLAFLTLGILSFLFMFFGSGLLANLQNDSGARFAIAALAPCVLFVCSMSAFRGYAQGHGDMVPTTISQIIEASLKLIVGLTLAGLVVAFVANDDPGRKMELAAAGAIIGVTTGSFVALLYLIFRYLRRRSEDPAGHGDDVAQSGGTILSNLVKIAIPITLGSSAVSIVNLIDTNLTLGRLQSAVGLSEKAAVGLYGTYQSALTLYNLPAAFMIPLTAAIIPAVAAAIAKRDRLAASRISESALRMASLVALPMGIGLTALSGPIIGLLYPTADVAVAGPLLATLGIASIFVCIMLICNSILQAHGFVNLPILTTLLGGIIMPSVNYVLVGNPKIGIQGAPIGTLCCFATVAILDMFIIHRVLPAPPSFVRALSKPALAAILMGIAAWGSCKLFTALGLGRLAVLGGVAVGGLLYLILVLVLKVFSKEDLALMPKGDKIAKFLRL
ncbi:MAG: polysaccharide biosynthesis protein [Oscillospiraceae bacterium]